MQAIAASHNTGKGFGGGAQHIHVRVVYGFVIGRGTAMDDHLLRVFIAAKGCYNPRPKHPRCSQAGDLHKKMRTDGKGETHPGRYHIDSEFSGLHFPQILYAGGQGKG